MATKKKLTLDKKTVSKLNETELKNIDGGDADIQTINIKCIRDIVSKIFCPQY
jgi:hypothetical protein